jgi:DNA replication and repair protein RecF
LTSYLRALRLINFRNYADDTVLLGPGLNVVVGDNAQGKTNLLEAISFAVAGRRSALPSMGHRRRRSPTTRRAGPG